MKKADVNRWLQAYVAAWKSYDRDQISALFAENVEYRYHPHDVAVHGRDAVVDSWSVVAGGGRLRLQTGRSRT